MPRPGPILLKQAAIAEKFVSMSKPAGGDTLISKNPTKKTMQYIAR